MKEDTSIKDKNKSDLKGVTVIIADDHQLFAEAIKGILINEGMIIQAICNNGKDAFITTKERKPQILLTDINMPGMEGTHLCKKVKEEVPGTKVIMISMYEENKIINKSFKNGADSYLSKGAPKQEMIKAIKKTLKGESYINRKLIRSKKETKKVILKNFLILVKEKWM